MNSSSIIPGLDRAVKNPSLVANLGRVGLVTNQAVTTNDYVSAVEAFHKVTKNCAGTKITAVFGAQHGYYQTEQDNMIETPDLEMTLSDGAKFPLFSLYSQTRMPTKEQLDLVDTLVVDLRDIGCRVYTYMLTLAGCLRQGAQFGKKVVVLDRPNPLGLSEFEKNTRKWKRVEGNIIDLRWQSFVGWYEIPMRHGLTMGELGNFFIREDKLKVDYTVITCEGIVRSTDLKTISQASFVLPSPNIPDWLSAFFFPAFVSLEGTNISEGRGSTLPFQLVGSPYLNSKACIEYLEKVQKDAPELRGLQFRIHDFRPTFNKHHTKICHGVQFHVLDAEQPNIFHLGIHFLRFCIATHGGEFKWREPGYEYNMTDNPILLILGDQRWLDFFEQSRSKGLGEQKNNALLSNLLTWADKDAQEFADKSQFAHIYT